MEGITIRDIARMCGVGVSTVSRVINDHPDVNPQTRERILSVIQKSGYIPNNSARNLKRTEARSIALVLKDIRNPFFTSMIDLLEVEVRKRGYSLVPHRVRAGEDEVDSAMEFIKEKRLQGVVFLGGYFRNSVEKLRMLRVPFVLSATGSMPDSESFALYSSVSVDDKKGSGRLVQHLIDTGHRDIAILAAERDEKSVSGLRLEGYLDTLEKNGIPIREELICRMDPDIAFFSSENGYETTKKLLDRKVRCTAICAFSDMVAIGVCRAVMERGGRIPQDYAVTGFDGINLSRYYTPSITTLRQPIEKIAEATVALLFERLENGGENRNLLYEGELLIRESTAGGILIETD